MKFAFDSGYLLQRGLEFGEMLIILVLSLVFLISEGQKF